jgi:hypothetical protein
MYCVVLYRLVLYDSPLLCRNETLSVGKFAWQMMWTGGDPLGKGGTVVSHPVTQGGCAAQLRALCNATSPAQTRAMMFSLKLVLSQEVKQYNTNGAEKFKHFLHPICIVLLYSCFEKLSSNDPYTRPSHHGQFYARRPFVFARV